MQDDNRLFRERPAQSLHKSSEEGVVYGCHPAPEKGTQGGTAANSGESPHIEESRAKARLSSPVET